MAIVKKYPSQSVAQKIADKQTQADGIVRIVSEADGKWIITETVMQAEEPETLTDTTTSLSVADDGTVFNTETGETAGNDVEITPTPAPTQMVNTSQTVTIDIPGAKLTAQYVITPTLGDRPRWFERKRLIAAEAIDGGARITCVTSELTSRKLGHLLTALDAKANETLVDSLSDKIEAGTATEQELAEVAEEQVAA